MPSPPCCPDLRPGGSDSPLGPGSPAAGVRRPQPVTSLTHTSSWLYPPCNRIGIVNCSLHWPSLLLLPPCPAGRGFLAIYLTDSGRSKEVTALRAKPPPRWGYCCWEVNAPLKLLLVWKLKTLPNSTGYWASLSGQNKKDTITHTPDLFSVWENTGRLPKDTHSVGGEPRSVPPPYLSLSLSASGGRQVLSGYLERRHTNTTWPTTESTLYKHLKKTKNHSM